MAEERQFISVGRRKCSVARVILSSGNGNFVVNGRPLSNYFKSPYGQLRVQEPLRVLGLEEKFDVRADVSGGGITGQADAICLGIARFLEHLNATYRPALKKEGLLSRDPRAKERKKYGRKRARKRFQFSKR
ncbi:MAG: 30S ribosomal protein S9 [Candidatus Riflebacteria bacterium RBG_13_59_9]|nr:MAG: 30S ribosomal protein S9 [Candidatus Riflebacteria bacterium RBG_13_59_9]